MPIPPTHFTSPKVKKLIYKFIVLLIYLFFGGMGVWTQGFALARQMLYCLNPHPPVHFALVILEMGSQQNICLGWPQTTTLPISASPVASITGVSHLHLATFPILGLG
jgi:hypothetical protein